MSTVAALLEHMDGELDDACGYAQCAVRAKEKDPSLADVYISLAREELNHFARLNEQLSRASSTVPANSEDLFGYMRKKMLKRYSETKTMVDSYK